MVTALGISMDWLFARGEESMPMHSAVFATSRPTPVLLAADRPVIELGRGVRWERLTRAAERGVEFLEVFYEPHGGSDSSEHAIQHSGRDHAVIEEGRLHVRVGFDEWILGPGDSLAFDGAAPHRFWNPGEKQVRAIFLVSDQDQGAW
jgi:mannose-6-phosphate isomerase-like protein (cupin superfamily)